MIEDQWIITYSNTIMTNEYAEVTSTGNMTHFANYISSFRCTSYEFKFVQKIII